MKLAKKDLADAQELANTERAKSAELVKTAELAQKGLAKAFLELAESSSACRREFLTKYRSMHGVFPPILEVSGGMLAQAVKGNVRDNSTCFLVSIGDWAQRKERGAAFNSDPFKHLGVEWYLEVHLPGMLRVVSRRTYPSVLSLVEKAVDHELSLAVPNISIGVLNMQSGFTNMQSGVQISEFTLRRSRNFLNQLISADTASMAITTIDMGLPGDIHKFISDTGVLVAPHFVSIRENLSSFLVSKPFLTSSHATKTPNSIRTHTMSTTLNIPLIPYRTHPLIPTAWQVRSSSS